MAMSFKTGKIHFSGCRGNITTKDGSVTFEIPVAQAEVLIRGFEVEFENSEHPVQNIQVFAEKAKVEGKKVSFKGTLAIKDNTGYYDDNYGGWIEVLTIANSQ